MKITKIFEQAKLYSALVFSVFAFTSCSGDGLNGSGNNNLNLGYGAKVLASVDLKPHLAGLMNFNGKTAEELLALRTRNAQVYPELLIGAYKPSDSVFQIASKTPWWGLKGYLFRSSGLDPTEGLSRESPYFANPFLLVCPEWYGTELNWPSTRFSTAQSFANVYPAFLQATSLKFYPQEKREELTYDVLRYYNTVKTLLETNWPISDIGFDLKCYNAEDFGYNYIYVDPASSSNLGKLPPEVMKIDQTLMVKQSQTCAPQCNDFDSPGGTQGFKINNLPAKCHLLLWRNKPSSHVDPTDFTVDLIFK